MAGQATCTPKTTSTLTVSHHDETHGVKLY
jgi:hypothetical protein